MKVASVTLLLLSLLVDRANSQSFVCDFCPDVGILNPDGVVSVSGRPDKTCEDYENDANAFAIEEGQCGGLTILAASVCCVVAVPTTSPPTGSPTESLAPTPSPTGKPTAAPSDSAAPTFTSKPTAIPSGSPTFAPEPECYDDLEEIQIREDNHDLDTTVRREYILCPNTLFLIGTLEAGEGYFGGSRPIFPRANVGYKCGEDGKVTNNCRFFGGTFQVFVFIFIGPPSTWEDRTDITFNGITFETAELASVVAGSAGDVTFTDCIFLKHNQLNAIYMNHDSAIGRRRLDQKEQHALLSTIDSGGDFNQWLKENKGPIEEQEEHDRDLQIVDPDKLKFLDVIVKNCVFEENAIAVPKRYITAAVVTAQNSDNRIEIYDSTFLNNKYDDVSAQNLGSAVESTGPVKIENTCFIDNEFRRYAPVNLRGPKAVLTTSGNYGNVFGDDNLACDFAMTFPTIDDYQNNRNFACIDYDAPSDFDPAECARREGTAPFTRNPTMAPTNRAQTPSPTPEDGAAGRVVISLSAAAAALTAYLVF